MEPRSGQGTRRALFLDEVEAIGLPALFSDFGDLLLFKEGTVYALPEATDAGQLSQPERLPGVYVVTERVGIEYPWRHAGDCACRFCASSGEREVA